MKRIILAVASLWDGEALKCTFSRIDDERLLELCQLASTIVFKDEEDSLVWQYHPQMAPIQFSLCIKI
jgi:hypothetical protein